MAHRTGEFQFKIFLVKKLSAVQDREDGLLEVRRFVTQVVDGPGAFVLLCTRLEEYLPSLQGRTYAIFWKDEEGDFIAVSTDQETSHAITYMHGLGGIVKLYALIAPQQPGPNIAIHPGVTCDGCNVNPIQGNRYKCLQCPDYDLCVACETKGVHAEHPTIRFTSATFPNEIFGRILKRRMRHQMRDTFHEEQSSSTSEEEAEASGCPFAEKRGRHHKEKGGHHHKEHHGKQHKDKGHRHESCKRNRFEGVVLGRGSVRRQQAFDLIREAAVAAGGAAQAAGTAATVYAANPANLQYLRNVVCAVTKMLDPLGVSVSVEPSTPDVNQTTAAAGTSAAPPTAAPVNTTLPPETQSAGTAPTGTPLASLPPNEAIQNLISAAVQSAPNIVAAVQQITDSLAQQHMEMGPSEGWTVVNVDEGASGNACENVGACAAAAGTGAGAEAAATTSASASPTSPTRGLYPDLTPTAPAQTSVPHPNQNIQRGVEILQAMGFSNEGNLLTQVLEIHNGDIVKAIDVLQVVRK